MGEIFINGERTKSYNVFVDEREKGKRLEFIVFLELNGYNIDKDETRSKETIVEGFLPIDVDPVNKEYRMMGNVTCAAAAATQKLLISKDEFCKKYMA